MWEGAEGRATSTKARGGNRKEAGHWHVGSPREGTFARFCAVTWTVSQETLQKVCEMNKERGWRSLSEAKPVGFSSREVDPIDTGWRWGKHRQEAAALALLRAEGAGAQLWRVLR